MPGVDYGWVLARAKDHFAAVAAANDQLDAKAFAVVNYFGGGAGVLAFVTAAGAATGGVSAWVAGATVVPFGAAVAALVAAVRSRGPSNFHAGPGPEACVKTIDTYRAWAEADGNPPLSDPSKEAEYAMAATWDVAAEVNSLVMNGKAALLTTAVRWKVAAITLLMLPLVVAVAEKAIKPADAPKPVYVVVMPAP